MIRMPSRPVATLILAVVAVFPAFPGEIVEFTDGRSMPVEAVSRDGDMIVLTLDGGGQIAVPDHRIVEWVRARPAAVVPARPVAATTAWRTVAGPYAEIIGQAARRHEIDPALLTAVAQVESAFDPRAVSPKGAQGLLQLMPDTAARFGVRDAFDAGQNVDGGARYLSWLMQRYEGQTELALAGYNAGEGRVDRYKGIPPYRETQNYVTRVLAGVDRLSSFD